MKHPQTRAERRRSVEAHSLEHFKPKRINVKKRAYKIKLLEAETQDELRSTHGALQDILRDYL